ncbi:hypothetical protein CPB84DRAFT_1751502 [Gymnopilus junonius]|uniref:Uncharacterized protein n=1 Tax=Gymnopilus junonius TaxID=109634 RepID=A0A9P5TIR9_GYMJU|nr:hypothetical protein CPB84DRAFT_1751502 [Gymnopilus junonius]
MAQPPLPGTEVLPPELWGKIFENIPRSINQESPRESWAQVSLTCHTFHSYMIPIMHRLFTFHPYVVKDVVDEPWLRTMPSMHRIDRELERLTFYSSEPIKDYVCGVVVRPWSPKVEVSSTAHDKLEYLSRAFYQSLHKFKTLRSLIFILIDLDSFVLQEVSQLPSFEQLGLINCRLRTPVDASLSLKSFVFIHAAEPVELEEMGVDTWLGLLDSDRLGHLSVEVDDVPTSLLRRIHASSPFNLLNVLTITVVSDVLPHLQSLLLNAPNLRHLGVSTPTDPPHEECVRLSDGLKALQVGPISFLEKYTGPRELLHAILESQPIRARPQRLQQLHISAMPDEGEHFDIIWNQLSLPTHSAQLKWLTHFHADFQFIKNAYFAKLLALFPNLQVLRLKAADPRLQDRLTQEMFLDVVCTYSSPSSQLRFLAIDWSANEDDDLDEKHQAAKDRLTENFPLLEELWLCDWRKSAFLWRRTADQVTIYPSAMFSVPPHRFVTDICQKQRGQNLKSLMLFLRTKSHRTQAHH